MSATPPGGMPPQPGYQLSMPARLPVPGNAEFLLWLVVEIVLAIVAAIAGAVTVAGWFEATKWITAAYLISRGIAKASRVLEH